MDIERTAQLQKPLCDREFSYIFDTKLMEIQTDEVFLRNPNYFIIALL